ncbi:UDP-N-acetylglucosamine 1-carboxyvinyltransferase [Salicibibacter kimchii]|uniref:UDP-N-acetylglucosamine 1-carboxyvinyltransferase n=1 Tax=Salicibibacter kimchii TaxID=2099786 RepID=A0A345BWI2_9BACI|nr:UDP-N-acetylglucosamine 1-carboxyvinyltransferase [Salicibibacter kimchii]AXF55313.1 UDP-N-acetylglucosamine 1-carboxyvinyltransferase [Salicibibacter kimchii]
MSKLTELSLKERPKATNSYVIKGGKPLKGEVVVQGAKNAALPALVAASLSDEMVEVKNVPLELNDVNNLITLLREVGVEVNSKDETTLTVNGEGWRSTELDPNIASKIRHSLLLLGGSIAKDCSLYLPLAGGCEIGDRKHDLHVLSLKNMGHEVIESGEGIRAIPELDNVNHTEIEFYYPSFGATLNVIFASVLRNGKVTSLKNAAKNPEVLDVIQLLEQMGATFHWTDENTLEIIGVDKLNGTSYRVMSDRIIVSTMIAAIAVTKGNGTIIGGNENVLETEVAIWRKAGLNIQQKENGLFVDGNYKIEPVNIETKAYPGFHTDIQPLHAIIMLRAKGSSTIKETILDGRFLYCEELNKLGANITIENGGFTCVNGASGQVAILEESSPLMGTSNLIASDIRGGAAVVLAALAADEQSEIANVYQIERGYSNLPELINTLGGNVERK